MTPKFLLISVLLFASYCAFPQGVGIGTSAPDSSAALDVTATNKGLLIPRMNITSINAIRNPANGLLVYDSVANRLMVNTGTPSLPNWQPIGPCITQPGGPPDAPTVLLKDVLAQSLPSPYYHFEYDPSKKVSFVSFASDFDRYNVVYNGDRISEMQNNILVNKDRLQYNYNSSGQVQLIRIADSTGLVYKTIELFYDGPRLVRVERSKKTDAGFVIENTITMSYYADGNLMDITHHSLAVLGRSEATATSHYEQYDNKINVDAFDLLHSEFFEHLFLLPGVQLQKNNPGKETHTGDGDNFIATYSYTYSDQNAPLTRTGDVLLTNGTRAGQHVNISTTFTYF